ncbi:MAG: alpha/beta fold hydrolase [Gammaproteobacteria bacterium]|nr:alpha/beta fold hydrolase [Gammaproteobacteria bacterium]
MRGKSFFKKYLTWRWVGLVLLILVLAALPFKGYGDRFFYNPIHGPVQFGLPNYEVQFRSLDGTLLSGVVLPAFGRPKAVIIYFHGRYGNIQDPENFDQIKGFPEYGYTVFAFDYRGYGESEGEPSRAGIQLDAKAAIEYAQQAFPQIECVILAQSLGVSIALSALAETANSARMISAVICEGGFYSYRSMANSRMGGTCFTYPLAWWLVTNDHSAANALRRMPPYVSVVLFHAKGDTTVPFSEGEKLFAEFSDRIQFWAWDSNVHLNLASESMRKEVAIHFDCMLGITPPTGGK